MKRLQARVYGRVQGVFFRAHTREKAVALGLTGWVRNNQDGTVETVAEGPEEKLQAFLAWLQQEGSPASTVERVEEKWGDASGEFTGFAVQR